MNEEQEIFPKQDYNTKVFPETKKVLWWAVLIIYISAILLLCETAINVVRLVLAAKYRAHNLPLHAHETLFNGFTGLIMVALRFCILALAFISLYRLKKFYKDGLKKTLLRALTMMKVYYIGTAIVLTLDILWYIYYIPPYIKLLQQYP